MANDFYQPQVNYQSRDFTSIRDDLLSLVPNFAPQWTSRDASDFGVVLVELFSYMGDILNYYIDRSANEGFLATATQRETVLNIARLLGYNPKQPIPAKVLLTLKNTTTSTATIKNLASFSTATADDNGNYINFEYIGTTATVAANTSTTITVIEGSTVGSSQVAISDGTSDQTYPVYSDALIYASSASVTVNTTPYTQVTNIVDYGANDTVYSTYYDGNGILNLRFGDGVSGKVPPLNSPIYITYRKGYGTYGNVGSDTIKLFNANPSGSSVSSFSITGNGVPSTYGTNPESMDSIRINAPLSLRALNRAVSLSDYAALALQSSLTVKKAYAIADNYNSIVIFVMGDQWKADFTNAELDTMKAFFVGKTPPGTTVTVLNGNESAYAGINISITAVPSATNSVVKSAVQKAIADLLAFDAVTFNDVIYQSDIYKAVRAVAGVNDVTIVGFDKIYASAVPTLPITSISTGVYFYANEVPHYNSDYINVTVTGGAA